MKQVTIMRQCNNRKMIRGSLHKKFINNYNEVVLNLREIGSNDNANENLFSIFDRIKNILLDKGYILK